MPQGLNSHVTMCMGSGVLLMKFKDASRVLDVGNGVGPLGVDEVRELDRVPDEKNLEVVADRVPILTVLQLFR
jgi:16S rRNA G1207 methylase RsmC